MKKVGINELYEMILEEIGVDEGRNKQGKNRAKNRNALRKRERAKFQSKIKAAAKTLRDFINKMKKQNLDDKTIKKAILLTLKQKGLNESETPEGEVGSEEDAATKAAKELSDTVRNVDPKALAAAAKDIISGEPEETTDDDPEEVQLPTDSEEALLTYMSEKLPKVKTIGERKDKNITLKRFALTIIDFAIEKLGVKEETFKDSLRTAFRNDAYRTALATNTLENMASKVVEIAKDYGLDQDIIDMIEENGKKLIAAPFEGIGDRNELWNNFFVGFLFPADKIEELKQKFIQLKNTRSTATRLDRGQILQISKSLLDSLRAQIPSDFQTYIGDDNMKQSYEQKDLFAWVNKMSKLIKEYFVGSRRAAGFQKDIKTLADLSEAVDDDNSIWNLNKKEGDPPDDFFIQFDEQLRNIARLKVWEDTDVEKLGDSIKDLGLNLADAEETIIQTVNEQAKTISAVAKKSKFYKGLETIDKQMSDSIEERGLEGFSKRKAQETFAKLKERFTKRYDDKYGTNYADSAPDSAPDSEGDEGEPTTSEDPIPSEEAETDKEKELIDDANRYSRDQYKKWFEDNKSEIDRTSNTALRGIIRVLSELLETVDYKNATEDGSESDTEFEQSGIDPEEIRENEEEDFDPESFSEQDATIEKMKSVGISEYIGLRVMSMLINERLYKLISKNDDLDLVEIKKDIKDSFSEFVELVKTLEMMDTETEFNESVVQERKNIFQRGVFKLMKKLGIPPGDFKAFYIHELIEKTLLPKIRELLSKGGIEELDPYNYNLPEEGKSEAPPYPGTSMKKVLKDFAELIMSIDREVNPVDEGMLLEVDPATLALAAKIAAGSGGAIASIKWAFSKGKFSLPKFFKVLSQGGNEAAKRYNDAMKAFNLNQKERANLAWYFSRKGNVEKFIKNYLKDHSQYKFLLRQDARGFSRAFDFIKQKFMGAKGYRDKDGTEAPEEDPTDSFDLEGVDSEEREEIRPRGDAGDPRDRLGPGRIFEQLENALKPIIESVMKEILEK